MVKVAGLHLVLEIPSIQLVEVTDIQTIDEVASIEQLFRFSAGFGDAVSGLLNNFPNTSVSQGNTKLIDGDELLLSTACKY